MIVLIDHPNGVRNDSRKDLRNFLRWRIETLEQTNHSLSDLSSRAESDFDNLVLSFSEAAVLGPLFRKASTVNTMLFLLDDSV